MATISTDIIFKFISMNEQCCILIKISLKFVLKGTIDNRSTLVLVMAWCRSGDKPLSEPMVAYFTELISDCKKKPQNHNYLMCQEDIMMAIRSHCLPPVLSFT